MAANPYSAIGIAARVSGSMQMKIISKNASGSRPERTLSGLDPF
jgi:hypothetical protein